MPDLVYLDADEVLILVREYLERLGFAAPILRGNSRELLESAVARPRNLAHYAGADLIAQAAALGNGIALNHPFLDGNKRAAFAAITAFLEMNGRPLPPAAFWQLADQLIAQHEQSDRAEGDELLAKMLRGWLE